VSLSTLLYRETGFFFLDFVVYRLRLLGHGVLIKSFLRSDLQDRVLNRYIKRDVRNIHYYRIFDLSIDRFTPAPHISMSKMLRWFCATTYRRVIVLHIQFIILSSVRRATITVIPYSSSHKKLRARDIPVNSAHYATSTMKQRCPRQPAPKPIKLQETGYEELRPSAATAFSAAIFSSIFRLAANIISSRLRCKAACRSLGFELQDFCFLSDPVAAADSESEPMSWPLSFSWSLYRVIRSGSAGRDGALAGCDTGGVVDGGGGGG
jgi:hypothetical protein